VPKVPNRFCRAPAPLLAAMLLALVLAGGSHASSAGTLEDAIAANLLETAADRADEATTQFMVVIDRFYFERGYAPIWTGAEGINDRGRELIGEIGLVGADGLDPADYHHLELLELQDKKSDAELARLEVLLSESLAWLAQHLAAGRLEPTLV